MAELVDQEGSVRARSVTGSRSPRLRRRAVRRVVAGLTVLGSVAVVAVACATPPDLVALADPGGPVTVAAPDVIGPMRVRGGDLIDGAGRTVLMHGVNSVAKWEPWVTPVDAPDGFGRDTLGPDDLAALDRDGYNAVRLGVWPAALMPAPGQVDQEYLDRVAVTVDALSEHGIWVLLDLHQDVFHGMPEWATTPAAAALSAEADPGLAAAIGWSAAYFSPRSLKQWDDWWANAEVAPGLGVVDAYAQGAAALADRFDSDPAVIGLELINEPFPGSPALQCLIGDCPDLDATVGARNAQISAVIRASAPEMPLWWEQETLFPNFTDATPPQPDVPPTADGRQVVSSFHIYCLGTDSGKPELPDPTSQAYCDAQISQGVNRGLIVGRSWGAPAVMTEFGASNSPLNSTLTTRMADEQLFSWFHWHHGTYPSVVESQLVRTYAQATAGTPLEQRFEPSTGSFTFRYRPDPSVEAPTSIVVPQRVYPDGYRVEVSGGTVTSAPNSGRRTVAADGVDEVTVRVTRSAEGI